MSKDIIVEPIENHPNYQHVQFIQPFAFVCNKETGFFQLKSICSFFNVGIEPEELEEHLFEDSFFKQMLELVEKEIKTSPFSISIEDEFPGYYIHPRLVNPIACYLSPYYFSKIYHPRMSTKTTQEYEDDEFNFGRFFHPYQFIIHEKDNYFQLESIITSLNVKLTVKQVLNMEKIKKMFQLMENELQKYHLEGPLLKVIYQQKAPLTNGTYIHPFIHTFISGYLSPEILLRLIKK